MTGVLADTGSWAVRLAALLVLLWKRLCLSSPHCGRESTEFPSLQAVTYECVGTGSNPATTFYFLVLPHHRSPQQPWQCPCLSQGVVLHLASPASGPQEGPGRVLTSPCTRLLLWSLLDQLFEAAPSLCPGFPGLPLFFLCFV